VGENIFLEFEKAALRYGDKVCLKYLGREYTYKEVRALSERFALALRSHHLEPGSRVIIYLPNSIHWVVAWLGVLRADGVAVPTSPIYVTKDIKYMANDSGATHIVCTDVNYGYVKEALPETNLRCVIVIRLDDLLPFWKKFVGWAFDRVPKGAFKEDERTMTFGTFLKASKGQLPPPQRNDLDTAEILYTGGTTKFPKGVPLSHGLYLTAAKEHIEVRKPVFLEEENVVVGSAPLFHVLGQTCALSTIFEGGKLILMPKVNLDAIFDAVERDRAKTIIGVPQLYRMILQHQRLEYYDLSSLRYCFSGGDVLPLEIYNRWKQRIGVPLYQGYGATETCGGVLLARADEETPPNSVGKVVPSKVVRLVDPNTLEEVQPGQPGELLVHSEKMVRAYLNKPEETQDAFVEMDGRLWYRTGDVLMRDEKGFFYFVDRTVDTIKHKGYRVSASEVEGVLQEHPAVMAACVVGIPDPKVGERIKAYVVLKEDVKGVLGHDLIKWCRERLASYKVPQYIEFRDMLPKSKVGKLLRREVRAQEKRKQDVAS